MNSPRNAAALGRESKGEAETQAGGLCTPTLLHAASLGHAFEQLTYAEACATVEGEPAVFVVTKDQHGRIRRRTFLALDSAHRAVERAFERGATAQMVLVHMTPAVGGEGLD